MNLHSNKPVILSGIQTSGRLILGNYMGAIAHWLKMQQEYQCFFMLADLHTLTVKQDPIELRQRCYDALAIYVACGIDPEQQVIFLQSHVPAHTQLTWILDCYTQMGELSRMTQFKDKSDQHPGNINAGLFNYPVLMAADILLYGADRVPVGEDQKQHLELTRDIAIRFNHRYGDIFTIPQAYIPKQGARIMSLQEPTKKMSKSDSNEHAYIALLDSPEEIRNKFKRAVTDSGHDIRFHVEKPGISNLLTLMSVITGKSMTELELDYQNSGYGKFKQDVADVVIEHLKPIQAQYHRLRQDETWLTKIFAQGAERASRKAKMMLDRVYEVIGLVPNPCD